LLRYGADAGYETNGSTPFIKACHFAARTGEMDIVALFLSHGANVRQCAVNGEQRYYPITSIFTNTYNVYAMDVARFLIKHGADIHVQGFYGRSFLECLSEEKRAVLQREYLDYLCKFKLITLWMYKGPRHDGELLGAVTERPDGGNFLSLLGHKALAVNILEFINGPINRSVLNQYKVLN
jgi:hypothetical protein